MTLTLSHDIISEFKDEINSHSSHDCTSIGQDIERIVEFFFAKYFGFRSHVQLGDFYSYQLTIPSLNYSDKQNSRFHWKFVIVCLKGYPLVTCFRNQWLDCVLGKSAVYGTDRIGELFQEEYHLPSFFRLSLTLWGRDKMDAILKCIFLNEIFWIPIEIPLKFVPKGPIDNIPALV